MRKIIQYMMMALIAVVLASCANDISEESSNYSAPIEVPLWA